MERGALAQEVGVAPAAQPAQVALRPLRARWKDGVQEAPGPGAVADRVAAVQQQDVPVVAGPGAIAGARQVDHMAGLANRDHSMHRMALDLY